MTEPDCQQFLDRWSRMILSASGVRGALPDEVKDGGGLGRPSVEEHRIQEMETRLMRQLPPSYRAFLRARSWL